VLGNDSNYPMLIGSNSGITIANNTEIYWIDDNGMTYVEKQENGNNVQYRINGTSDWVN